jgi:hypothetical protein
VLLARHTHQKMMRIWFIFFHRIPACPKYAWAMAFKGHYYDEAQIRHLGTWRVLHVDLAKLTAQLGVPEEGTVIKYETFEEILGLEHSSDRFKAVLNSWRKGIYREHGLEITGQHSEAWGIGLLVLAKSSSPEQSRYCSTRMTSNGATI